MGHKHQFLADLEWLVIPPLMLRQSRIYMQHNKPFAYASWAIVSEEVEQRMLSGNRRLKPEDWRSGDRAWLVDVVAPFGGVEGVMRSIKTDFFSDRPLFTLFPGQDGKAIVKTEIKMKEGPTSSKGAT